MAKAVYAGSFDPVTNGHLWMIKEGAKLFDKLVVAVGTNPNKEPTFSLEERVDMLKKVSYDTPNVTVDSFENQFLVHYANSGEAKFILRGIRSVKDYEDEKVMIHTNSNLNPNITTSLLIPPEGIADISSSSVKNLIGPEHWEDAIEMYVPRSVYNSLLIKFNGLQSRWDSLWKRVNASGSSEEAYTKLLSLYGGAQRSYHNLVHIVHSLREMDDARDLIQNPDEVEFALWYHDSEDNEEKSAELAEKRLSKAGLKKQFTDNVTQLILATNHKSVPQEQDAQYICDIDLAILGKPQKQFDEYERGIRYEYQHIPEEQFKIGRAAILKKFLDRKNLYSTDFFKEKYETQARENLERSLVRLN